MLNIFLILFLVFVIGITIGSFLNVVILRSLSDESIVVPASKCPNCQHKLYWWHNIPILSFILLKGKCAFCGEKISWQYPIVEFLTGVIFVLVVLKYGININSLFGLIISSLFIVMAVTDWKEKVVFDKHAYILICISLFYALLITGLGLYWQYSATGSLHLTREFLWGNPLTISLLGMFVGALLIEVIARIGKLIFGTRLFGEGDTYIMAALGTIFDWKLVCIIFVLAILLQVIITIPLFVKKEIERKNYRSIFVFSGFMLYAVFFYIMQVNLPLNIVWSVILTVLLCTLGIWTCVEVLKGIKEPVNQTLLPFGPALIIVGFVFLLL